MANPNLWSGFISKAFVSLAALFILFQVGGTVFAQEENPGGLNFMKNPDITIRDLTIDQGQNEGDEKIAGTFTIYTLEPKYNGDLYYEVSLVRVRDDNQSAGDTDNQLVIYSSFPESSPINLNEGKHKVFNYSLNIPENIWGGLFLVKIKLYTGSGALISSGQSEINLKERGKFLEITDKFIEPVFKKDDKIYFSITALNSNTENINTRASVNIRKENRFGELVKDFNSDQFEIPAGNEVEKKFELKDLKAGLYSVSLQLINGNNTSVSNIVYDKFMVEGENALLRILEINPDKLAYADGDTAKIGVKIGNPQSSARNGLEIDLAVKLTSAEESKIIGEKTEKVFIVGSEKTSSVEIPVKRDLKKYKIIASLSQNGKIVGQKEFQSFSSGQSNEAEVLNGEDVTDSGEKTSFWKYLISAGIILALAILLAGLAFIGFKKFKTGGKTGGGKGINTLPLLLFAIGSALAFSMFLNVENAQADGTLRICVYGKLYDSDRGYYNERLPRADIYWNGTYVDNTGSSCYTLSGPAGTYNGTITAKKPSYTSNGVNYHFYNKSRNNFILRDGRTTRINFYLDAKPGGVTFYTYVCNSNALGNATVHYESASVNTDNGGHYTLNGVYPGIYRYLYASKSGYANSDANYIPISSEKIYSGPNARFCLKPLKGSVAGRVTVCGFSSQGIGNADMLYRGNLLVNNATNSNGYYSYTDIAAGTYDRISFGGVSGFNNSSSQSITINPNTTTTANFCLRPNFNSLSYSWLPADGTNYFGFAGKIDYNFFINNSTVGSFDDVTVEFLFDGGVIRRVTKDVLRFSNTEFAYDYWNFFIPIGSHSVDAKVYWNGSLVLSESRTINVRSFAGGWMTGDVTDCESEVKIPSARVSCGGDFTNTNAAGHYRLRLPIGDYSGAHASKTGYEDSISRNVTITENKTTNTNFCMNRETGAFVSRVLRNGLPVDGARVYWDDPSAGANNLLLGTTNSNGFLSGINIAAGTYNGIYASAFSRDSAKKTVIIRANQTTRIDFTIPSTPVPTLNATLNASPSSGSVPLTSDLTTNVTGTATGTIAYSNQSCGGGIISNVSGGSFRCQYNNPGTYTARIRVSRQGLARNATRNITVSAVAINNSPSVEALPDGGTATVNTNAGINCGSTSDPEGDPLTYQWTQVGGPAVTINNSNQCNASFTVGSTVGVNYVFNLSVSDGINPPVSDQADITSVAVPCLCNTGCEVNTCTGTNCNDSCGNPVCPGTKDCSSSKNWKEVAP